MKDPLVISELRKIAAKNGGLLVPSAIVEAATSESSPLHDQFEWDDSIAAHEHRLWQARILMNITVNQIKTEDKEYEARVFVSLKCDREEGGYREMTTVLSTKALREQLLKDALEELEHFKRKYKHLRELAEVFEAMSSTQKRLIRSNAAD